MENDYKYIAFMSYSHHDEKFAKWLHKKLETYRVPSSLRKEKNDLPRKLYPIFRDMDELSASSSLNKSILEALSTSKFLIVICSTHSAKSKWVNREIVIFKTLYGEKRVLPIILNGEPNNIENECFPEALKYRVKNYSLTDELVEPIAADARGSITNRSQAKNKLIAGILGVGFDEINQRELKRQRERRMFIVLGSGVLSSLGTFGVLKWKEAKQLEQKNKYNLIKTYISKSKYFYEKKMLTDSSYYAYNAIKLLNEIGSPYKIDNESLSSIMNIMYFGEPSFLFNNAMNTYCKVKTSVLSKDNRFLIASCIPGIIIFDIKLNKIHGTIFTKPRYSRIYYPDSKSIYSFKNRFIAYASPIYNEVYIWDYLNMKLTKTLKTSEIITYITGSKNEDILYCGSLTGKVEKWSISENRRISKLDAHNGTITSMIIANLPKENLLITSSKQDGYIKLWDLHSNTMLYKTFLTNRIGGSTPTFLYLSPSHLFLFVGDNYGNVIQYETKSLRRLKVINITDIGSVEGISLYDNAQFLLVLLDNGILYKINYIENSIQEKLSVSTGYTRTMSINNDERNIFIGTTEKDKYLLKYTKTYDNIFLKLPIGKNELKSFFKRAKKVIDIDDKIILLRNNESFFIEIDLKNRHYSKVLNQDSNIIDFQFDSANRILYILLDNGDFIKYLIDSKKKIMVFKSGTNNNILSNMHNHTICIASRDGTIHLIDCNANKVLRKYIIKSNKIKYIGINNDYIVLISKNEVTIYDTRDRTTRTKSIRYGTITAFDIDKSSNNIAIGRENRNVLIIDLVTLNIVYEFYPIKYKDYLFSDPFLSVTSLFFNQKYLYVGLFGGELICLDTYNKKELYKLTNKNNMNSPIVSITLSSKHDKLYLSCAREIKLFNISFIHNPQIINQRLKLLEKSLSSHHI